MNGYKDKYKDIDIEKYNSALASNETLKASIKQMKADHEAEISNIHKGTALDTALSSYKFTSSFAKMGIKSEIEKMGFELDDNGSVKDFDNTMKTLMESHKDAFVIDGNNEGKKPTIMTPMGSSGGSQPTPEEYLQERYKNNPFVKF